MALARKEAAQMEATYKADRAQWMQEVDMGKFEVSLHLRPAGARCACLGCKRGLVGGRQVCM